MFYGADYHTHSNFSDGKLSPAELIRWAKDKELSLIALTDHDTVEGIDAALIAGEALEMEVMPGVELTAVEGGVEVHIVGLNIDHKNAELLEACKKNTDFRAKRNEKYFPLLKRDFGLEPQEFAKTKSSFVGRMDMARTLVERGFFHSVEEVFGEVFGSPEYSVFEKEKISARTAISAIKASGGTAVWAHPARTAKLGNAGDDTFWDKAFELAKTMKGYGLAGIEAISLKHNEHDRIRSVEIAEKLHLHITQGSDYHGD